MRFKWLLILIPFYFVALLKAQNSAIKKTEFNNQQMHLIDLISEIRALTGVNYIYSEKLIGDKYIENFDRKSNYLEKLKEVLDSSGFAITKIDGITYVIHKKKKEPKVYQERVETTLFANPFPTQLDTTVIYSEAKLNNRIELAYPQIAARNHEHGKVNVKVLVNVNGNVSKAVLQETSGNYILDSVALSYTKTLKFIPAKANANSISSWVNLVFKYILD